MSKSRKWGFQLSTGSFLWMSLFICLSGCRQEPGKTQKGEPDLTLQDIPLRYARGFVMQKRRCDQRDSHSHGGCANVILHVQNPWQGASEVFTYNLYQKNSDQRALAQTSANPNPNPNPNPNANANPNFRAITEKNHRQSLSLEIPVARMVTLTTTHLYHLEALGLLNSVVGMGGGRYACNSHIRKGLQEGTILEVGADGQVDVELIVGLKPDMVLTYGVGNSSDGGLAKLREAQLAAVIEGSYMEETPLGRAEWIKFTAAFFDKEKQADSIFAIIDSSYRALLALTQRVTERPTVMVNAPFGGIWWMPGGRSYVARFLKDAGANYLWAEDTTRGSLNLDLEAVLAKAGKADFWLNPGEWKSLGEGRKQDPRAVNFEAFKMGRIYNSDKIRSESGGNDIFETGPARPDWVLADLIFIFHPELLPNHTLHWYRKLEEK